jgi:flagellar L-ring protein FlgH
MNCPVSIPRACRWLAGVLILAWPALSCAQGPPVIEMEEGPQVRDLSWVYADAPPPPPEIKVHDIIMIEVDEKAEVIVNSRFNRQRNGSFTAQLKEFVRISDGNLEPAALNAPAISGTLQNRLQTIGTGTDTEGITYKIGATIVDVLPNGTLIVEARKTIRSNQDFFEYRLTGRVDKAAIKSNRTVRTESFAELDIYRNQRGKIFDSTKVNWGTRVLDIIWPF